MFVYSFGFRKHSACYAKHNVSLLTQGFGKFFGLNGAF
jgi:hypothetical protein